MTDALTIDTSEIEAAAAALEALGAGDIAGEAYGDAMRRIADEVERRVVDEARRHSRTGRMVRQIGTELEGAGVRATARVRAGGPVALFVALGTDPHPIRPVRSRALAFGAGLGLTTFAARVQHPGTTADPFFARGREAAEPEIRSALDDAAATMAASLAATMTGG